jgi:hypothetical protein
MTSFSKRPSKPPLDTEVAAAHVSAVQDPRTETPGAGHNSDVYRTKKNLLVTTYRDWKRAGAVHYVEGCRVVVEAEDDLPSDLFKEFCEEVGLPRKSSMFRKARAVAKAADRLLAVSDRLPDSRSAITELAWLEPTAFAELVNNNELTPSITAAQVRGATTARERQERCLVSIDATELGHAEKLTLVNELREAANKYGAKLKVPKLLRTEPAQT